MGFEPTTSGITIRRSNQLSYSHRRLARIFHTLRSGCNRRVKRLILQLPSQWVKRAAPAYLTQACNSPTQK